MQLNYLCLCNQTKYMQLAKRLWVRVQAQPMFIYMNFNLGTANGATVGLKLRLVWDWVFTPWCDKYEVSAVISTDV